MKVVFQYFRLVVMVQFQHPSDFPNLSWLNAIQVKKMLGASETECVRLLLDSLSAAQLYF